jgi:hypothetical protein
MAKTVSLRQRGWPWDELRRGPSARNEACRSPGAERERAVQQQHLLQEPITFSFPENRSETVENKVEL